MRIAVFALALALAGTGARGVAQGSAAVEPLPRKIVPITGALSLALATDSVWISHDPTARALLVPPDVARRFRELLLRSERVSPGVDPPAVCSSCPDQLTVRIGFPRVGRLEITMSFREAQARYMIGDGWVGWSSIRRDGPELLALVKRSLPADSVVQRHRWSPAPDSLSPHEPAPGSPEIPHLETENLPQALFKRPPVYPDAAREAHVQGTVVIEADVDEGGRVVGTKILRSIPMLDDAAVTAVRGWIFKPAMKDGRSVRAPVTIPIKFTLH